MKRLWKFPQDEYGKRGLKAQTEASGRDGRTDGRTEGGGRSGGQAPESGPQKSEDEKARLEAAAEFCTAVCSSPFCLQDVPLERHMVAFTEERLFFFFLLHSSKARKRLIPSFMCGKL